MINPRYPQGAVAREVQDHYFRLAKQEGYRSRAAYKLIEIDDRKKLMATGDCVLDCGAAPGSWLQVAARRVGPRGIVVGVDLQALTGGFNANVRFVQADFTTVAVDELLGLIGVRSGPSSPGPQGPGSPGRAPRLFDVILSDMAPNTTGDHIIDHHVSARLCESVLDRCAPLLRGGGQLAMKVFEGETYPALMARSQRMFEQVKGFKPKASRSESTEIYIIAKGFRAAAQPPAPGTPGTTGSSGAATAVPKRRPSAGWSRQT